MAIDSETTKLWKMVWDCLTGNAVLVTALGHAVATPHLGRVGNRKHLIDPCITFGQQTMNPIANQDQPRILSLRRVYFTLNSFSEKSDAVAADNMELTLEAIVGQVLSYSTFKTNPIEWDGFTSAPYYDEDEQAWRVDARILIIIKSYTS